MTAAATAPALAGSGQGVVVVEAIERPRLAGWRPALLLAAASLGLGLMCIALSRQPGAVATLWLPNALGAVFWAFAAPGARGRILAAHVVGVLGANLLWGDPFRHAAAFVPANLLEVVLAGEWLRRRWVPGQLAESAWPVMVLLLQLALGVPLAGAVLGAATLQALDLAPFGAAWATWYSGAVLGSVVTLPVAMAVLVVPARRVRASLRHPGHLALWLATAGVTLLAMALLPLPFAYVALPLLVGAALADFLAAALAVLLAALMASLSIAMGWFAPPPLTARWQEVFVHLPLAATLLPPLLLAMMVAHLRTREARQRALAERLAHANAGLEQFVRIASHDLREPLNTIASFGTLIEQDHGRDLPQPMATYLQHMRQATVRLRNLLDDVLAFVRLDAQAGAAFEPVALEAVLDDTLQALRAAIDREAAVVERAPLPVVRGQRALLALLLQNLLANALKFHAPATPPRVRVWAEHRAGEVVLTVADRGIGIAPEHQPRLFGLFARLHPRSRFDGTGLGLALCRRIAELHGGRIWIESEPDQGTRVHVALPENRT